MTEHERRTSQGGLSFRMTFHGPFHIATGKSGDGADSLVDRDNPLPASSLKGLLRSQARDVLRLSPRLICDIFGDQPVNDDERSAPGAWAFSDGILDGGGVVDRSVRIKTDSDGMVDDEMLLTYEQWWSTAASFSVTPIRRLDLQRRADHELVLRAAARSITALGAQRRRGSGWVTVTDDMGWQATDSDEVLRLRDWSSAPLTAPVGGTSAVPDGNRTGRWVRLRYRIDLEQATSVGAAATKGNTKFAAAVIPGSTVRGALAACMLAEQPDGVAGDPMAALFERDLTVHQAIPVGFVLEPVTAYRPKYGSGGSVDTAADWLAGRTPSDPIGAVVYGKGFRAGEGVGHLVRRTRTRLHPEGYADPGALFTRQVLANGTRLVGTLAVAADSPHLDWLTTERIIRLGAQLTIGGRARWTASRIDEDVSPKSSPVAVLQILSPTIVVDEFGAPTVDIKGELRRLLGSSVEVAREAVRTEVIGGWHTASGLSKPQEWAIAPGSCYLLRSLPSNAASLVESGVGLRRLEGFGQVRLATDVSQQLTIVDPGDESCAVGEDGDSVSREQPSKSLPEAAHAELRTTGVAQLIAGLSDTDRWEVLTGLLEVCRQLGSLPGPTATAVRSRLQTKPWLRARPQLVAPAMSLVAEDCLAATRGEAERHLQEGGRP